MGGNYRDELLEHNETFYAMTKAAAMLGSQNGDLFDRDAQLMIDFLGQVYGWPPEWIEAAESMILGCMLRIGLMTDVRALASIEMLGKDETDQLIFYEIKGKVL